MLHLEYQLKMVSLVRIRFCLLIPNELNNKNNKNAYFVSEILIKIVYTFGIFNSAYFQVNQDGENENIFRLPLRIYN